MKKRYIIPIILLIIIGLGGYFGYKYLTGSSSFNVDPVSLVPSDAVFFAETNEPIENWKQISKSEPWKFLKTNSFYKEINESADDLDQLISKNEKIFGDFGSRKVVMSAHCYRANDYDYLYLIDLENVAKIEDLILELLGSLDDYKTSKRNFHNSEIYILTEKNSSDAIYLSFIDNVLAISYTNSLIEKVIKEKKENKFSANPLFVEVSKKVKNEGIFRLYFNYAYLDEFMNVYSPNNEYVKILSETMAFSGLSFEYDESNTLMSFSGYSNLLEDKESYLGLLQKTGSASMHFSEVVPKRAGLVTALNTGDFAGFYDGLESQMKETKNAKWNEYEENVKKIERFLKISVKDDFLGWIDDEICMVQTQPIGMGRENELALFLKASSGSNAKSSLDKIGKQIKKRTPVKFKGLDYKGYEIKFLSVKGLFKLLMGDFFGKIEKPYYTIIDDYVIFSNHPQTIKSIIDDYINKQTLSHSDNYKRFEKSLNLDNSLLIYVNTSMAQGYLTTFLDGEAKNDVNKNKKYFEAFPNLAFQISANGNGFDTKIVVDYLGRAEVIKEQETAEKEKLTKQSTADLSGIMSIDPETQDSIQLSIKALEESALIGIDEIILEDLDVKKQEETFENGDTKLEFGIKDGLKHGNYTEYNEKGEVIVKGQFKKDQKVGTWRFYDENGNLVSKKKF